MEFTYAQRMDGLSGNAIREIFALLARPDIISLAGGNPSPEAFPVEKVNAIVEEALKEEGPSLLQYGATEGYAPLRESAGWFMENAGVKATAENTLIVSGGQQGIDLMCKVMLNPGDAVLVENPTYLAALHIIKTYQGRAVPVKSDDEGVDLLDLEEKIKAEKPKFLYLVPTFQNPTGRTMSKERRKAVAELTARLGLVVIEDDPYRDLRYSGEPLPAVKSFDTAGNVLYLNSFSKVIAPGLRVAAAVGSPELLRKLTLGKQATDVHSNMLGQVVVDRFIRKDMIRPHIAGVIPMYRTRLAAMMKGFEAMPAWLRHTTPEGGLFVWCDMPESLNAEVLFKQAVERSVAFVPGTSFFANGDGKNTFRLNFSMATPERISQGMEKLAELMNLQQP